PKANQEKQVNLEEWSQKAILATSQPVQYLVRLCVIEPEKHMTELVTELRQLEEKRAEEAEKEDTPIEAEEINTEQPMKSPLEQLLEQQKSQKDHDNDDYDYEDDSDLEDGVDNELKNQINRLPMEKGQI
ncbi:hypothetical protein RFI_07310, partial [Reticulomyxa filosa]